MPKYLSCNILVRNSHFKCRNKFKIKMIFIANRIDTYLVNSIHYTLSENNEKNSKWIYKHFINRLGSYSIIFFNCNFQILPNNFYHLLLVNNLCFPREAIFEHIASSALDPICFIIVYSIE